MSSSGPLATHGSVPTAPEDAGGAAAVQAPTAVPPPEVPPPTTAGLVTVAAAGEGEEGAVLAPATAATADEDAAPEGGQDAPAAAAAGARGRKRGRAAVSAPTAVAAAAAQAAEAAQEAATARPQRRAKQAAAAAIKASWQQGRAAASGTGSSSGNSGSTGRARAHESAVTAIGIASGVGSGAPPATDDADTAPGAAAVPVADMPAGVTACGPEGFQGGRGGGGSGIAEAAAVPATAAREPGTAAGRSRRAAKAADGTAAAAEGAAGRARRRAKVAAPEAAAAEAEAVAVGTEDDEEVPTAAAASPAPSPTPAAGRKAKRAAATAASADPRFPVLSPEEAEALRGQPLLDLGELVVGKLIRRPSASIKTPYVADVLLLDEPAAASAAAGDTNGSATAAAASDADGVSDPAGRLVLAHAPAMDCAGMVAPGARLYLSASSARREGAPPTATSHAIQLVEDQRPGGGVAVVGSHPQLAERLAAEMLRRGCLAAALGPYRGLDSQRTFGSTRVDYVLRMADGSWTLLEVKNVVCADFPEGGVPAGRPAVGVYTSRVTPGSVYQPTALFPHGAAKPKIKVVSDRAIKHVWELTQLHAAGQDPATGTPLRCAVLFVVNRGDCAAFRPCHEADPLFAQVLKAAGEAGVQLLAFDVDWRGGRAHPGRQLPVVFGEGVSAAYDPDRLREVLDFNATDPRKNWKKAGAGGAGGSVAAGKKKTSGTREVAATAAAGGAKTGGRKARKTATE